MKKFIIFFIILILIGGALFFLGWAQFDVPPGSYGIVRSKTHGLENRVVREGEFRWLWYKLIPTNVEISVYEIIPVNRAIRVSGTLSSGEVYASIAGVEADFSWEISGEISFSLKPDHLPQIAARENTGNNDDLRIAEEKIANGIENLVLQRLKIYADSDEKKMETIIVTGSIPELNSEILESYPEIENFTCSIKTARYPDYVLYQSLKALYREYVNSQNAVLAPEISTEASRRMESRLRLNELTMYGELLTKYPILLQYLALEKGLSSADEMLSTGQ